MIKILLLLICAVGLSSCSIFRPNMREFIKGNVIATSYPRKKPVRYNLIEIGTFQQPFCADLNVFRLRQGDIIISSDSMNFKFLREKAKMFTNNGWANEWGEGSEYFRIAEYNSDFVIKDDKVLYWKISNSIGVNKVFLGSKNGSKMYPMPLTEEQMIEIFGKPDKIVDYHVK